MRAYVIASGTLFSLIFLAWAARLMMGVPVTVDGASVPLWVSVVPIVVTGTLATWAFSLVRRAAGR